ncbi:hypothetical protein BDQ17DRAFT_1356954 [Cyathus striatus]|nr:hypothetical protein BDQ17DRAFT_1356954 [Cyathus striatus]
MSASTTPRARSPLCQPWWTSSPVNKLPAELLSIIFLFVTQVDPEKEAEITLSQRIKIPLALSTVCSRWRQIALDTPHLWTEICITPGMIGDISAVVEKGEKVSSSAPIDVRHITSFVALSRTLPLDIYVDARDEKFNFIDPPDISEDLALPCSPVLFTAAHMRTALKLLVPQIHRWRSLTILTDTWEPMYTALNVINEPLLTKGAPLLESLELVRCNDYASQDEKFSHPRMNKHQFLDMRGDREGYNKVENILPRLETLQLRGVHAEWSSLASILTASKCSGLKSLTISSHAGEVRPSLFSFHDILKASPRLESLSVQGSCVRLPRNLNLPYGTEDKVICHDLPAVDLPLLRRVLSSLFQAPNATHLSIGYDRWYSAYDESTNASSALIFFGTGKVPRPYIDVDDAEHISFDPPSCSRSSPLARRYSKTAITLPIFPSVSHLVLQDVEAEPHAFHTFFSSLPHLSNLEFSLIGESRRLSEIRGSTEIVTLQIDKNRHAQEKGLVPLKLHDSEVTAAEYLTAPCPQLKYMSVRRCDMELDIPYLFDWLSARRKAGADKLKVLDLHESSLNGPEEKIHQMTLEDELVVRVFSRSEEEEDELEDEVEEVSWLEKEDEAFKPGGAFNDPDFDAEYGDWLAQSRRSPS